MPFTSTLPAHLSPEFRGGEEILKRDDLAVPQLYEWHAEKNPDYPFVIYHDGEAVQYITYKTANRAIDRAARYIAAQVGVNREHAGADKPVVGILANAGERIHRDDDAVDRSTDRVLFMDEFGQIRRRTCAPRSLFSVRATPSSSSRPGTHLLLSPTWSSEREPVI